ncbi:HEAT repeat domain-containing protein [Microseira wollei]|uniref:PBS lyase HEAT-like repeat protein n=1 Tax=Microseira wollei NIES-4236 TaxID=2530354 RepID=A0AAV3X1H3_9CYAN|nr:HEAT repeat domain-containing protein [Microseira wollei]GET35854.1 PBS lyase HEAT-like repeat protein [Microseira wollei NIES-4236]
MLPREDAMQWFWDKKDDLGLARFVIYSKDSEAVKTFIEKAVKSSHLPKSGYDLHQDPNDGRKQLVEKIYHALRHNQVEYDLNEFHELSGDRQLIRTPEEILDTQGKGTCLDLAILFCAICWYYDLLSILILVEGHALVAVSLTHSLRDWENEERRGQQLFWEGLGRLTDTRELQKMVKREDYLAFECTGFAKSETLSECEDEKFQREDGFLSFDQAVELGCKQLERRLKFALDIHIAYNFWWSKVVCQNRLEAEPIKRLINNPLTNGENPLLKLYVSLGLIERKPDAQRRPSENDFSPEGSLFNQPDYQYEVVREYKHKEFFEEVLKHKSSSRSQGKRLAIVGDPGGGKTTLLQRIAYWILEEEQGLPIWVPLGSVEGTDKANEGWLYRYLSETWLKNVAGEPEKTPIEWQQTFAELLKSGQVWLLLDGADEMALKSPLTRVKEQLAKGWAESVRVVLSCRLNLWEVEKEALWEKFDIYRTLDFSYPDQVHQFINNWFGEDNPKAKGLQDKLAEENRKRLQDLVKNPLRLALLCRIWKKGLGTLPDTKADFYRLLVENHYKWKDDSTNEEFAIPEDRKKELNRALGQLARDAIDREDFRFRLRESYIRKYLQEPNEKFSLFWWALKLGWLLNVGFPTEGETNLGEKVYAFFHPTFQEYLASTVVDNYDFLWPIEHRKIPVKYKNNPEIYKRYRIFVPQCKEVILLWLGRPKEELPDKQKERFIQALVQFKSGCGDFYWYRSIFLAAAGIAEFDCSRSDEIVASIIALSFGFLHEKKQEWMQIPDCIERVARSALKESDRQRVYDWLVDLQNICQDGNTNFIVAMTIANVDLEEMTKEISDNSNSINDITEDEISDMVRLSIQTLRVCQNKINLLSETNSDLNERGQFSIKNFHIYQNEIYLLDEIEFLGKHGNGYSEAINALIELLDNNWQNQSIYREIALSLGRIGIENPKAVNALIRILDLTQDEETRQNVAFGLGKISTESQKYIDTLIKLLDSKDEETRLNAASSLARIGTIDPEAINKSADTLIDLLYSCQRLETLMQVPYSWEAVLSYNLLQKTVIKLKRYLNDEVDKNNDRFHFDRFKACYQVIWYCAQNMTYPDFYKAWHSQPKHRSWFQWLWHRISTKLLN